jgi:hypothetical protein
MRNKDTTRPIKVTLSTRPYLQVRHISTIITSGNIKAINILI